jgi:hypothetical protein
MTNRNKTGQSTESLAQQLIDGLDAVDCAGLSFVQLRRLNAALLDAGERVAEETAKRSATDAQGDTVRVAVPHSLDR